MTSKRWLAIWKKPARNTRWSAAMRLRRTASHRFSEDIDIFVDPSAENARRWVVALSRLPDAAAKELLDESDVFADDKRYAIRINDEFTVDVMPSIAGLSWEEMTYTYDALGRLTQAQILSGIGTPISLGCQYDAAGNRMQHTGTAGQGVTITVPAPVVNTSAAPVHAEELLAYR